MNGLKNAFVDNLRHDGFTVASLYIDLRKDKDMQVEALFCQLQLFRPDLVISCCDDRFLTHGVCSIIQSLSIPSVLLCCDNLTVPFKHKKSACYFDLTWLTSYKTIPYFSRWGANPFLCLMHNPYFINVDTLTSVIDHVVFVGIRS